MKRFLSLALLLSFGTFGLVGCSDTSTEKVSTKVETDKGTLEKTQTTEVKATGNEKPADAH